MTDKGQVTFIPEGDCIEVMFGDEDYYALRIDDRLTAFYSRETDRIVGVLIKRVSAFCRAVDIEGLNAPEDEELPAPEGDGPGAKEKTDG